VNIEEPIKFLFIGRLLKEKGVHDLISAIKIVKKVYPEAYFTILGEVDASNMGALQKSELDELIASNIVNYPGHVDNVKDW
ncbi:glycosyltransferase, partial [Psychrobacter sp. SIMBA_152]